MLRRFIYIIKLLSYSFRLFLYRSRYIIRTLIGIAILYFLWILISEARKSFKVLTNINKKIPDNYAGLFRSDSLKNITYVSTGYYKLHTPVSTLNYRNSNTIAVFSYPNVKLNIHDVKVMRGSVNKPTWRVYSVAWSHNPELLHSISDTSLSRIEVQLKSSYVTKMKCGDSMLYYHLKNGEISILVNDNSKPDIAASIDMPLLKRIDNSIALAIIMKEDTCYIILMSAQNGYASIPPALLPSLLK